MAVVALTSNNIVVNDYVESIINGEKIACVELVQACKRYKKDLENKNYDFRADEADSIIWLIENTIVLLGGEDEDGSPFRGRPFLLQPWQKFIVYNLFGFYKAGTDIKRFTESLVFVPKKNGKASEQHIY